MVKVSNRDSTTARYTSPHEADVKTLCKQECMRMVHSKRCRYALIPLVLFLTVLVVYVIFDYPPEPPPFCASAACIRTAWNLKQSMNLQVKPCDDFYSYVCGGNWSRPSDKQKPINDVQNLLAENVSLSDPFPVRQAKQMFKVCTDRVNRIAEGYSKLDKYYRRFGLNTIPAVLKRSEGWAVDDDQQFDWIGSVAKIRRSLGLNVLIGADVADTNQIVLGYPDLPKGWDYPTSYSPKVEHVSELFEIVQTVGINMLQVAVSINPDWNITDRDDKFDKLAYQVQDLYRILPNRSTTTSDDDQMIMVRDLDTALQRYLNSLFYDLSEAKPLKNDKIQISSSDLRYLSELIETLAKQDPEQIELYIWGLVSTFLIRHRFSHVGLEADCAVQVRQLMGPAISYMAIKANNRDNLSVEVMLQRLKPELKQTILAIDWMDELSRNSSSEVINARIEILERILNTTKIEQYYKELEIGSNNLENWINGLEFVSTDRLKSWRSTFGSRWDPSVSILKKPFRDLGLDYLNYGSLGVPLISDLLTGLANSTRWSNRTTQWYQNFSTCFPDNQSAADAAGLQLALQVYHKSLKPEEKEPPLPEFLFTPEQAFFISHGWQICNGERSDRSKSRINVVVSNLDQFSKAFECPSESLMNTENKCGVW